MMPGDVAAALYAGVHPISADSDARPVPQVHHSQGGELPDFGREEMNQTRVPSKVHISELFVHRDVAPHAAETDAAGGSLV